MAFTPDDYAVDFESTSTSELAEQLSAVRMPPHSIEAEQAVLGCLLINAGAFDKISEEVVESDFYQYNHRVIFRAINSLVSSNHVPDVVTVAGQLQTMGMLEDANGIHYIGAIAQETPSVSNIKAYAEIVRERSVSIKQNRKCLPLPIKPVELVAVVFQTSKKCWHLQLPASVSYMNLMLP